MRTTEAWAELGLLAERAAMAVDERETELVDRRLAVVLATVPAAVVAVPAGQEVVRFAAAARDVARPLHRRVAAVAALHHALSTVDHNGGEDT